MRAAPLLIALTAAGAVAACGGSADEGTGPSSTSETSVVTQGSTAVAATTPTLAPPPAATDIVAAGGKVLDGLDAPDWLAIAGGWLWAAGGNGVDRLNLKTGKVEGTVPVPGAICLAMDVGVDALWVGSCGSEPAVLRVDPATGKVVATIAIDASDLSPESSIAAAEDAVWLQTADADLVKIDPATNKVVTKVKAADGIVALRAGLGALWATNVTDSTLQRLDAADASEQTSIPVGEGPRFLAVGEGAVWVLNQADGTVTRVDPATNAVVATIDVDTGAIDGGDIAVGGGAVWARVSDSLVVKIDPATNAAVAAYGPPNGSGSVAADDAAMWISAHDVNSIWRLPLAGP